MRAAMAGKTMNISVIGCGLRTPLLIHGFVHSGLPIERIRLYDPAGRRLSWIAQLCSHLAANVFEVETAASVGVAIEGSAFVISSFRVGDMQTRAADERLAVECGMVGQETTGPAGFAMALRTIPVAIALGDTVARIAPKATIINFTNPAGLVTQAILSNTRARAVGICDTPEELIHQVRSALGDESAECRYLGLNHLGWIQSVLVQGKEVMPSLLRDDDKLRRLYPAELFSPALIRELELLPTEYLFYYYNAQRALENQLKSDATRGEELVRLNQPIYQEMERRVDAGDIRGAVEAYKRYLNQRNDSYMRLEGAGESTFSVTPSSWDPFQARTGYHRIAVEAIAALSGIRAQELILNVPNQGTFPELGDDDVIEVPCQVDTQGARILPVGPAPELVRPLLNTVKLYERLTLQAAQERSRSLAIFALMSNPVVRSWDLAQRYVDGLLAREPELLH